MSLPLVGRVSGWSLTLAGSFTNGNGDGMVPGRDVNSWSRVAACERQVIQRVGRILQRCCPVLVLVCRVVSLTFVTSDTAETLVSVQKAQLGSRGLLKSPDGRVWEQQLSGRVVLWSGSLPSGMTRTAEDGSGTATLSAWVSGTAKQNPVAREIQTHTPVTLTSSAGTCKIEVSPDGVTYTELATVAPKVTAAVVAVVVKLPSGWYLKLTVANATLGTTTYI